MSNIYLTQLAKMLDNTVFEKTVDAISDLYSAFTALNGLTSI